MTTLKGDYAAFERIIYIDGTIIIIVQDVLCFFIGIPLHCFIVYRLLTKESKINNYQKGVILQSVNDVAITLVVAVMDAVGSLAY